METKILMIALIIGCICLTQINYSEDKEVAFTEVYPNG
jgi:hypothetical protein